MAGSQGSWIAIVTFVCVACSSGSGGGSASDGGGAKSGSGGSTPTGGTTSTGGTTPSGGTTSSGGTAGGGGMAGVSGSGGSIPTDAGFDGGEPACLSLGTAPLCIDCCYKNHPSWEKAAPATRDCVCVSPGTCASVCGTDYCQAQPGSDTCYSCIFPTLAPGAACYTAAKQACGNDADCEAYVDCRAACVSLS